MTTTSPTNAPVSAGDRELLDKLYDVINGDERPVLLGREGAHIQFPEPVFHLLVQIVRRMHRGQSVAILPRNEELTTQAAADHLGMSRPYFVKLLEDGELPHHMVGSHRRVYLHHLLEYAKIRNAEKSKTLSALARRIQDDGYYDSDYTGEK